MLHCRTAIGTPRSRGEALDSDAHIVAINYDNIGWLAEQDLSTFDAIVFDELTKLKNPSGTRFKALHKVIDQFKIRWGLTGSFTSNGLEDVFGQCKIVDEKLLRPRQGRLPAAVFRLHEPRLRRVGTAPRRALFGHAAHQAGHLRVRTWRVQGQAARVPCC
jgi:hypothetical protein